MPHSSMSPETVEARLKEERALDLRVKGKRFKDIAEAVGYADPSGAHRAVARALDRVNNHANREAEELIALELDRYDRLHEGLWPKAVRGDVRAVEGVLKVSGQRLALLGILKNKLQITGQDDGPVQVAATLDLGGLTPEELEAYGCIARKLTGSE